MRLCVELEPRCFGLHLRVMSYRLRESFRKLDRLTCLLGQILIRSTTVSISLVHFCILTCDCYFEIVHPWRVTE